jgi:hypothetical protein
MIVVVEGISASGKSTWYARHGGSHVVPENGRIAGAPDRVADPTGAAAFWAERNIDRWQAALAVERTTGHALCDTDPLKLERPEFTGHVIGSLMSDPDLPRLSGDALIGAELAEKYGIRDRDGNQPPSHRETLGKPVLLGQE